MSVLLPLQAALSARLTGDAPLMARVTAVYDGQAPQSTPESPVVLPYVVIGEPTEVPQRPLERAGWSATLTLHVWSNYPGRREALEIADLMDAALAAPLALTGHTSARLKPEFRTVLVEADGVRHAPVRYRILTFAT